ncbi:MAG: hypothetical protein AABX75_00140 [Nanoarchaeota archaeon]
MALISELAKVLVGGFAADMLFHMGMLLGRTEVKFLGMKFTNKRNTYLVLADMAIIAVLAWLAWLS